MALWSALHLVVFLQFHGQLLLGLHNPIVHARYAKEYAQILAENDILILNKNLETSINNKKYFEETEKDKLNKTQEKTTDEQ